MADLADVENALVNLIGAALYPDGVPAGNISPVANKAVRVYRDWPVKKNIDADIAAGIVNVSVFARPEITRRTTRYPRTLHRVGAKAVPSLSWSVSGNVATLSGAVAVGLNVALRLDGRAAVYTVLPSDTLASIVSALEALLAPLGGWTLSTNGASLTAGGSHTVVGVVGGQQPMQRELRRQEQTFKVTVWAPDGDSRDAVAAAIDAALAAFNFITLADGSAARLLYATTGASDTAENESLFRRDLDYQIEYATTQNVTASQVVEVTTTLAQMPSTAPSQRGPIPASDVLVVIE